MQLASATPMQFCHDEDLQKKRREEVLLSCLAVPERTRGKLLSREEKLRSLAFDETGKSAQMSER